ncbi:MAG: hypothetical protein J4G05_04835 [Chlorobi bacterium]|nr:hypothetical protein [Chlorobiota bacterium]
MRRSLTLLTLDPLNIMNRMLTILHDPAHQCDGTEHPKRKAGRLSLQKHTLRNLARGLHLFDTTKRRIHINIKGENS